eukprot:1222861-Rhodomonas_salina.1
MVRTLTVKYGADTAKTLTNGVRGSSDGGEEGLRVGASIKRLHVVEDEKQGCVWSSSSDAHERRPKREEGARGGAREREREGDGAGDAVRAHFPVKT